MTFDEAVALVAPAVEAGSRTWADLGAGSGTFTAALAHLLGPDGHVIAVERDARALGQLRTLARGRRAKSARIDVVEGDLLEALSKPPLAEERLDGVLLGNVLHFFADPGAVLEKASRKLDKRGKILVLEYEGASPSRWVPHPVSKERLATIARELRLSPPRVIGEKRSQFRGTIYSAVIKLNGSGPT